MIITIDGPSSSGKSTLAKLISDYFSIIHIDSGSIYRTITHLAIENKLIKDKEVELEKLIKGEIFNPVITTTDETIEDPTVFALEKHLEDFLVQNWNQTPLGKKYDIYKDEENSGQQFPTDTGPIDILAISKDEKEVLVVELKKGISIESILYEPSFLGIKL